MDKRSQENAPDEPKQRTPKGLEIPVPKRKDMDADFEKLVRPVKKPKP